MLQKMLVLLLSVVCQQLFAQSKIETKTNEDFYLRYEDGTFVTRNLSIDSEGKTTIPETNCKATVLLRDGRKFRNVNGRISLLSDNFIYTINDSDFVSSTPVEQILFDSCTNEWSGAKFKTGFPRIEKQSASTFYQVLVDGKATLLKYYRVKWNDVTPFNSTNITRYYSTSVLYYLYIDQNMYTISRNFKNLPDLLGKTPASLKTKIDYDNEKGAIQFVNAYNKM
jgi:hypothetical protein